jgi:pyoverdine/dityrosine biosynthesis protein Dit1
VFVLPAFPFKSKNKVKKVLGDLPDKAEELALENLARLEEEIVKIENARIRLIIALDGFTYSDIVEIESEKVIVYSQKIVENYDHKPKRIEWFDFFEDKGKGEKIQSLLDEKYSQKLERIREEIEENENKAREYAGLVRFWFDDLDNGNLSVRMRERRAKEIAIRMIARNRAYSKYLEDNFEGSIRLSIHASPKHNDRFHINLIPENPFCNAPWHNVALKTDQGWKLVKKVQAMKEGATLVCEKGVPSYFESVVK